MLIIIIVTTISTIEVSPLFFLSGMESRKTGGKSHRGKLVEAIIMSRRSVF